MERFKNHLPLLLTLIAALLMLLHGPIPQPRDYHHFADSRGWPGIPHVADVLSNLGFAMIGIWGWVKTRHGEALSGYGRQGYRFFLAALVATAAGSAFYHLQPDDFRLVWDRLPIALACAGLLSGVYVETKKQDALPFFTSLVALAAVGSVAWWYAGELQGHGDLRPYLLLQIAPLVLIPLWQHTGGASRSDRRAFLLAIGLYVGAKFAELHDHEIMMLSDWISGHTLKHLLATAAAGVVVCRLSSRSRLQTCQDLEVIRPLRRRSPVRGSCA